jgi:hypothetical protein
MRELLARALGSWPDSSFYLYREAAASLACASQPDGFLAVVEEAWRAGAPLPMPLVGQAAALYRHRCPPHGSHSLGACVWGGRGSIG